MERGYTDNEIKEIERRLKNEGIKCKHDDENSCDWCFFDVDKCKKVFDDFNNKNIINTG